MPGCGGSRAGKRRCCSAAGGLPPPPSPRREPLAFPAGPARPPLGAAAAFDPGAGTGLTDGLLPVARNLLGFTGIALLLALASGGLLSWVGPLAFVGICQCASVARYSEPVTWAARPPADRGGWIAALVVFALALAAFTIRGPRIRPSGE